MSPPARTWRVELHVEPTRIRIRAGLDGAPPVDRCAEVPTPVGALETLETWFRTCREANFCLLVRGPQAAPQAFTTTQVYLALHFVATAVEDVLVEPVTGVRPSLRTGQPWQGELTERAVRTAAVLAEGSPGPTGEGAVTDASLGE